MLSLPVPAQDVEAPGTEQDCQHVCHCWKGSMRAYVPAPLLSPFQPLASPEFQASASPEFQPDILTVGSRSKLKEKQVRRQCCQGLCFATYAFCENIKPDVSLEKEREKVNALTKNFQKHTERVRWGTMENCPGRLDDQSIVKRLTPTRFFFEKSRSKQWNRSERRKYVERKGMGDG